MSEIKWDVRRGAEVYRIIYDTRLKSWISTGKIKVGEVIVWRSGLSGWRKAEELEELKPFFEKWERLQLAKIQRGKPRRKKRLVLKSIKNILIIEDNKDLSSLLQDFLTSKDYNVSIANSKREALHYLRRDPPDLTFLDLKLPDGDGMNLLSKIKKINPHTIVNIITAYGTEDSKAEAFNKGVYSFIDKPFTEKEILNSIRGLSLVRR